MPQFLAFQSYLELWSIYFNFKFGYGISGTPLTQILECPFGINMGYSLAFGMPLPKLWNAPIFIFGTLLYLNMEYSLAFGMSLP